MLDCYQLLSVDLPDHLIERLSPEALSEGWQNEPTITQQIVSMNCIIDPLAPGIKALDVQVVGRFPFDERLKQVQSDLAR